MVFMLSVHQISKSFGVEIILREISFNLNRGERLGLVGPNGCGKTTLLQILVGEETPDSGMVTFNSPDLRLGYLPQGMLPEPEETIGSYLGLVEDGAPVLALQVEQLAKELVENGSLHADVQHAYDRALAELAIAESSARRAPGVLARLGLGDYPIETPAEILSGGQKTRLALAKVLLSEPQLLLLDEPTNHLDIDMLEWLEGWLNDFSGAALIVSHDRTFLDRTATSILEIDGRTHTLKTYSGNYTTYLEQKLAETDRQRQAYIDQQEEIARLKSAAAAMRQDAAFKKGGKGDSGDKFAKGFFANRTKGTVKKAKNIEKRIETLLTDERLEKPHQEWQMKLEFGETPGSGRDVLILEGLTVGYGDLVLLENIDLTVRFGARAALIGPNGSGKTTLLRTIAGKISPLKGQARLGSAVRLGYMTQEQEELNPGLNALETLRNLAPVSETGARTFLHRFLFSGDDVFTPVGSLSYGERARLVLSCLVASGCNFLLLDEPINHLDIPSRTRFEQALQGFEGTVLAVVHDRYFIQGFATEIWEVRQHGLYRQLYKEAQSQS
jgi:ATP-binding cassette subfamily F protein 3